MNKHGSDWWFRLPLEEKMIRMHLSTVPDTSENRELWRKMERLRKDIGNSQPGNSYLKKKRAKEIEDYFVSGGEDERMSLRRVVCLLDTHNEIYHTLPAQQEIKDMVSEIEKQLVGAPEGLLAIFDLCRKEANKALERLARLQEQKDHIDKLMLAMTDHLRAVTKEY